MPSLLYNYTTAQALHEIRDLPLDQQLSKIVSIFRHHTEAADADCSLFADFVKDHNIDRKSVDISWERVDKACDTTSEDNKIRSLRRIALRWSEARVKYYKWKNLCTGAVARLAKVAGQLLKWEDFVALANIVMIERHEQSIKEGRVDRIGLHICGAKGQISTSPLQRRDIERIHQMIGNISVEQLLNKVHKWLKPCYCLAKDNNVRKHYGVKEDSNGMLVSSGEEIRPQRRECCSTGLAVSLLGRQGGIPEAVTIDERALQARQRGPEALKATRKTRAADRLTTAVGESQVDSDMAHGLPTPPSSAASPPAEVAGIACERCCGPCEYCSIGDATWDGPALHQIAHQFHNAAIKTLPKKIRFATSTHYGGELDPDADIILATPEQVVEMPALVKPVLVRSSGGPTYTNEEVFTSLRSEVGTKPTKIGVREEDQPEPSLRYLEGFKRRILASKPLSADHKQSKKADIINALSLPSFWFKPLPAFMYENDCQIWWRATSISLVPGEAQKNTTERLRCGSGEFNLMAGPGAYSGFHEDLWGNTYLTPVTGEKLFFFPSTMDEHSMTHFIDDGDKWIPTDMFAVPVSAGDTLIFNLPHAALTIEASFTVGAPIWHRKWMPATLRSVLRHAEHPQTTNEDFDEELALVLQKTELLADTFPDTEEILRIIKECKVDLCRPQSQKRPLQDVPTRKVRRKVQPSS